ncbi:ABC transporter ATP-binding protein [Catenulispora sp. NF23]|uniref:ABC transporter ATP-binding protein n=1 Tax=Catenulispora pinistramenti TaxID=2705254 RepID=A0ABS5KM62_9ACTN|nr:ABC transporter ATP-binding protein [Catenulispora pinistramenti]MBS2531711.1 ABC transporter ATP-binding protein [Catenulispora pinistramenti]MBS2547118.1 ABC transporter ATP-binding protein [Catenulispora pinistramenti]
MTALLSVEALHVAYGRVEAVKGISMRVLPGQTVALLGANGAGKTTTLRTLSGLLRPTAGTIRFAGQSLERVPAHHIVRAGLAHCPEARRIFPRMTIEENLRLGAFIRGNEDLGPDLRQAYERFPILGERHDQMAGLLSGGEQQMLAIARALMCRPRLLMLDEPSMGLSPIMMQQILRTVAELKDAGTTILLVEQNAQAALALADYAYVLETGRIVVEGTGAELLADERVREAYLGEG